MPVTIEDIRRHRQRVAARIEALRREDRELAALPRRRRVLAAKPTRPDDGAPKDGRTK